MLFSIAVLVLYVHHIGQSLRVSALIELVGADTRKLLDERYPPSAGEGEQPADGKTVLATTSGVVCEIDHEALVEAARRADSRLTMVPALGEYVAAGAPMFRVEAGSLRVDCDEVLGAVVLGLERTLEHDVAYGFRMLVDMAERSISESPFQDPTTTVQALDRLHECLRQLAQREFPDGTFRDESGAVRLVVPVMDWDAYVVLAFEEIRLAGARSPQVSRRLAAAFEDLLEVAPPERRPAVERQRDLLRAAIEGADTPGGEATFDLRPDRQGVGVSAGAG